MSNRDLTRPGFFTFDKVKALAWRRRAASEGLNVDVGVFEAVVWSKLEAAGDKQARWRYLDEIFQVDEATLLPGEEPLPIVLRFKIVEPGARLPKAIRGRAALTGSYGSVTLSPNKSGWALPALVDGHTEQLAEIADWVAARGLRLGWIEVGSYGIWGEWHFTPKADIKEALYAESEVAARYARAYADVFGARFADLPYVIPYDVLLHEAGSGRPRFELAKLVSSALEGLRVRMDMVGDGEQGRLFEETCVEAVAAGVGLTRGWWGGEGPNSVTEWVPMSRALRGEPALAAPAPGSPLGVVRAYGGQLSCAAAHEAQRALDILRALASVG